jgi:hypothetical protein
MLRKKLLLNQRKVVAEVDVVVDEVASQVLKMVCHSWSSSYWSSICYKLSSKACTLLTHCSFP